MVFSADRAGVFINDVPTLIAFVPHENSSIKNSIKQGKSMGFLIR
jgi:hypothetical protein